jgi:hypothetical protein
MTQALLGYHHFETEPNPTRGHQILHPAKKRVWA